MCYASRDLKGAKEMENFAISAEYYYCRVKYFSLLYELKLYNEIRRIFENDLTSPNVRVPTVVELFSVTFSHKAQKESNKVVSSREKIATA